VFGTDMPLGPPNAVEATISDIEASSLDGVEAAKVFAGNAEALLGI